MRKQSRQHCIVFVCMLESVIYWQVMRLWVARLARLHLSSAESNETDMQRLIFKMVSSLVSAGSDEACLVRHQSDLPTHYMMR